MMVLIPWLIFITTEEIDKIDKSDKDFIGLIKD